MTELLSVREIDACYGPSHVLHRVSLAVGSGEVVLLLGRNGAGKTTTIRALMGLVAVTRGVVEIRGRTATGLPPHQIARRGVGYVPEDRRMFAKLTVRENLELGRKPAAAGFEGVPWGLQRILTLFPALEPLLARRAGVLSGGQQQMLTIARTLMGNPVLLLLDEPAEGLAPIVVEALAAQLAELKKSGLAMLISEQNLSFGEGLADRAYVLESGYVRHHGSVDELLKESAWTRYIAF
ncbi:MAG: ABC transporter ATP-binding protein [Xanthobacteraceae bacterium]